MNGYKDLIVWQKAMNMVTSVYMISKTFPATEQFGLTSQLRRAAVSVPSNIAEGYRRKGEKDRRHFYIIAQGSVAEVETQLELSSRLGFVNDIKIFNETIFLLSEISKILYKLSGDYSK
jgi:four helix bundle protein